MLERPCEKRRDGRFLAAALPKVTYSDFSGNGPEVHMAVPGGAARDGEEVIEDIGQAADSSGFLK